MMTEQLTLEHFLPHLEKVFRVSGFDPALILERVDTVTGEHWQAQQASRQPFNLIFRGPPGNVLPQGLYTLEVEDGPSFDLYIIPVYTPAADRQDYQAAFN